MKAKYEISLPYILDQKELTSLKLNVTTSPCYVKLFAEPKSYRLMDTKDNLDEIIVEVNKLPAGGSVYLQHSAFPYNYMEWRAREIVTEPRKLAFHNYEQVYILLPNPGSYELAYKRYAFKQEAPWRNTFNLAITIGGSVFAYLAYFFIFEFQRCSKWLKSKKNNAVNNVVEI